MIVGIGHLPVCDPNHHIVRSPQGCRPLQDRAVNTIADIAGVRLGHNALFGGKYPRVRGVPLVARTMGLANNERLGRNGEKLVELLLFDIH